MPTLDHIVIHPIKALDGMKVRQARALPSGGLEGDRRWAIVDASGKFINGKRTPVVHRLRARFDDRLEHVTFVWNDQTVTFALADVERIENFLADVFAMPARLLENAYGGYPDDTESPGPTVVSTATLEAVASWFRPLTVDDCRPRFRANLEIGGVPPFWEDRLFGPAGSAVGFRVGSVVFAGTNPCQRCVVPTRDAQTGEVWPNFMAEFMKQRQAQLPPWAEHSRFNHFYRLAVNTHLVGDGGVICVGDEVRVESP